MPTGHTHDDVDGCFGVVKVYVFAKKPIATFSQFKKTLKSTFKDINIKCIVHDFLVVCPSYQQLYEPCLDSLLGDLHILEATMHQWRFEAVAECGLFPLGVKTCYKPYSSDVVVVFEQRPKSQCLSPIGQATGLEPFTMYTRWRPSREDDPVRNVEGFYLLKGMPHVETETLSPVKFPEGSVQSILNTLNAVMTTYSTESDADIRKEWNMWAEERVPTLDQTAEAYVTALQFKNPPIPFIIPMKGLLLDKRMRLVSVPWLNEPLPAESRDLPLIEWPQQLIAATNSVRSEMNRQPMPFRVYLPSDVALVEAKNQYEMATITVYNNTIGYRSTRFTIDVLSSMLWQRCSYQGSVPSISAGTLLLNNPE